MLLPRAGLAVMAADHMLLQMHRAEMVIQAVKAGNAVILTDSLEIITHGNNSIGILAVSEGGRGGDAGGSVGIVSHQGKGSSAGKAGSVEISTDKNTTIVSNGDESTGILGQSIGGSGGNSGYAVGIAALGGSVVLVVMRIQ